jgi:hypothetical protein
VTRAYVRPPPFPRFLGQCREGCNIGQLTVVYASQTAAGMLGKLGKPSGGADA